MGGTLAWNYSLAISLKRHKPNLDTPYDITILKINKNASRRQRSFAKTNLLRHLKSLIREAVFFLKQLKSDFCYGNLHFIPQLFLASIIDSNPLGISTKGEKGLGLKNHRFWSITYKILNSRLNGM